MASIENRSQFKVTVQNRDDLTQTFTHSAFKAVKAYIEGLTRVSIFSFARKDTSKPHMMGLFASCAARHSRIHHTACRRQIPAGPTTAFEEHRPPV